MIIIIKKVKIGQKQCETFFVLHFTFSSAQQIGCDFKLNPVILLPVVLKPSEKHLSNVLEPCKVK